MPCAGLIHARGGRYYPRLDAYAGLWMQYKAWYHTRVPFHSSPARGHGGGSPCSSSRISSPPGMTPTNSALSACFNKRTVGFTRSQVSRSITISIVREMAILEGRLSTLTAPLLALSAKLSEKRAAHSPPL